MPLLVIEIHNCVLQQTDPRWQVVDLKSARRHNRSADSVHVFRQATSAISAHLVPYSSSPDDPAHALLHGGRLSQFASRRGADGSVLGGPLGSFVVLDRMPLTLQSIMIKRIKDTVVTGLQFDLLIPMLLVRCACTLNQAVALARR